MACEMTLRDYYAAIALNGLIASTGDQIESAYWQRDNKDVLNRLAAFSYNIADAMLVERLKGGA